MKKQTDYVSVTLPRATGKEEDFVFVGLNGKGYTIRRGVTVRVPGPVQEILAEAQRQQARQQAFIRSQQENACLNCDYFAACHFSEGENGERSRYMPRLSENKVWGMLEGGGEHA